MSAELDELMRIAYGAEFCEMEEIAPIVEDFSRIRAGTLGIASGKSAYMQAFQYLPDAYHFPIEETENLTYLELTGLIMGLPGRQTEGRDLEQVSLDRCFKRCQMMKLVDTIYKYEHSIPEIVLFSNINLQAYYRYVREKEKQNSGMLPKTWIDADEQFELLTENLKMMGVGDLGHSRIGTVLSELYRICRIPWTPWTPDQ